MRAPVRSRSRTLVLVGILAGHAVLIYIMATSRAAHRPDRSVEFHSLPIYLLPLIEDPPPIPKPAAPAPTIRAQPGLTESTAIAITEPQQAPAPRNAQAPQVDWSKEAATTIQNLAQAKSGPVTFGDRPQDEAPAVKAPYGVFDTRSPRKAGYIEEIAPGVTRKWVSERCYREFGHLPELLAGPGLKINPVRCLAGPGPVFGDLFDHLKPEYLKRKDNAESDPPAR